MERPLFSDMLVERRMQLGLSIKQASNVLRLKEDVLIAFEEGDFDSIPKSGYAQGMLSSYARYLGLNAKTVVNQFTEDLRVYESGRDAADMRRRRRGEDDPNGPLYETPQAMAARPRRTYVESHGFLPTAGGFAGDMGDFATTSSPRRRMALEGHAEPQQDNARDAFGRSGGAYPQDRPYNLRVPASSGGTPLVQYSRSYSAGYGTSSRGSYADAGYRSDVTTRRVQPQQYRDDMTLDNTGGTYQSASSVAGRRSSRNIASVQRPNVRRRSGSGTAGRGQKSSRNNRRPQEKGRGGLVGVLQSLFQDRSVVLVLIFAVLTIVMTVVIISTVRSCVGQPLSKESVTVSSKESTSKTKESSESKSSSETVSKADEQKARQEAADAKKQEGATTATERTIEVAVADGEVTWLEIEYEGASDVAETVTGPWTKTYTVLQSLVINANKTAVVTVSENGKKLEFDSKASGLGTITVQVAKKDGATTSGGSTGAATQGNTTQTNAQTQGTTGGQQTTSADATGTATGTNATATGTTGQQTNGQQTNGQQTNGQQTNGQNAQNGAAANPGGIPEGYDLDSETGAYYGPDGYYYADGSFHPY